MKKNTVSLCYRNLRIGEMMTFTERELFALNSGKVEDSDKLALSLEEEKSSCAAQ